MWCKFFFVCLLPIVLSEEITKYSLSKELPVTESYTVAAKTQIMPSPSPTPAPTLFPTTSPPAAGPPVIVNEEACTVSDFTKIMLGVAATMAFTVALAAIGFWYFLENGSGGYTKLSSVHKYARV